jgi:2-polyprenyl-6-methoxyphenol hydroxylase-like FAD-dependent oxidoreductase
MPDIIQTGCCIAGGGPAGVMLGFLLARMGVDVVVLEKHKDFLRDFRGDTIHPSTLELMYELGFLQEFLQQPHQEARELSGQVGEEMVPIADFTHLPTHCKFLALMPQWDFLNFLVEKARKYPSFHLLLETKFVDLIEEKGRVVGALAKSPDRELEIQAELTIGADGRRSDVRNRAGLKVVDLGAPIDVMWMRLSRKPSDPGQTFGRIDAGHMLVLIDREEYWQIAFVIPKGASQDVMRRGLPQFRQTISRLSPFLSDRVDELQTWDDVRLLTVVVDRLETWSRPGLLCIGDSAHAMSPIGGVGINLAIQDAVATANLLGSKLRRGQIRDQDLAAVERRRRFPTRATQRLQVLVQNRVIRRVLESNKPLKVAWPLKLFKSWAFLRRIPARLVGIGFRPEHIKTPEVMD